MNDESPPLLTAYLDEVLCTQAAEQLAEMLADREVEAQKGADLPDADRAALLRKVRQPVS